MSRVLENLSPEESSASRGHNMVPNEMRYFDEDKGMTLNMTCSMPQCEERIWVREGVYTSYEGKKHLHNRTERVMSVETSLGPVCHECYQDFFE